MEHIDEVIVRFDRKSCFNTQRHYQQILQRWFTIAMIKMVDIYYGLDVPLTGLHQSYISRFIKNPSTPIKNPRLVGFAVLDSSRDPRFSSSLHLAACDNIQMITPLTTQMTPISTPIGPPFLRKHPLLRKHPHLPRHLPHRKHLRLLLKPKHPLLQKPYHLQNYRLRSSHNPTSLFLPYHNQNLQLPPLQMQAQLLIQKKEGRPSQEGSHSRTRQ